MIWKTVLGAILFSWLIPIQASNIVVSPAIEYCSASQECSHSETTLWVLTDCQNMVVVLPDAEQAPASSLEQEQSTETPRHQRIVPIEFPVR